MVDIASLFTVPYIISTLVNALIAFVAIVLVDRIIAHNFDAKHALIMALVALFLAPVLSSYVLAYSGLSIQYFSDYIFPFMLWIILGEILLKADMRTKLKVAAVAFVVYIAASYFLSPMIINMIPRLFVF